MLYYKSENFRMATAMWYKHVSLFQCLSGSGSQAEMPRPPSPRPPPPALPGEHQGVPEPAETKFLSLSWICPSAS